MAIRLTLECGHVSILRERISPEGFTHDWEVFVRGVDNTAIHHYIEKVVFQLHETFPKPKRVIKEPPYVVKESGYAGFEIPIHVYLKNKDEPKRFQILYKLHLQPRGRIINKVIRHIEIINNPSEEFRRKLLKGGGFTIPSTESTSDRGEVKTPVMVGKPKLSIGGESKKYRPIESKTSNSFAELFGPPIKTAKISPESKKVIPSDKSNTVKPISISEKADKVDKITKSKDSPHKDTKKDKTEEKKDKKIKDPSKEKSRSKEKSKRPSSPASKGYSSPTNKRLSPAPVKRPRSSSPPSSVKRSSPPKSKEKDIKKSVQEKEREKDKEKDKEKEKERDKDKDKDKDKVKDNSKSSLDVNKTDKKKEKKKYKDDNYKEKKEKYKEGERSSVKEAQKISDKKLEKADKEKEKSQDYKSLKDGRKSPKTIKESDKIKDDKLSKVDKLEKSEKSEKVKENKSDKDRTKHKHKKKDKKEKRDSSREREKKEKREKSKSSAEKQNNVPASSNPLSMLFAYMPERDSSDSAPSVDEESFNENKTINLNVRKELDDTVPSTVSTDQATRPPSPPPVNEVKKDKSDRSKRDKPKSSRGEERENRKRKRRSESKGDDEHNPKREKDRSHSTSPLLELVSSSQSPVVVDGDSIRDIVKEKNDRNMIEQTNKKEGETDGEQVAPDSTNCTLVESDSGEPPVFSEDYVSQLKELQHKIMTLQDNDELQRVVRVIEETGQYEITKKTFDFDLCALDRRTVHRLQQFFSSS